MSETTVKVKGLREFQKALKDGDAAQKKLVKERLKKSGEIVRVDAANRLSDISPRAASTLRVVVRASGVSVQQSKGKKTGLRPDFGTLQMVRALLPSAEAKQEEVREDLEEAMDEVAAIVNHA